MKIYNKYLNQISLLITIIFLVSCSTEAPITSDITFFADVQIIGDRTIAITEGNTFTDPGAISLINGEEVSFTTAGSVDTNTPGIYNLTYETINDEGFSATAKRTVVVLSSTPSIYDLSGSWARTNGSPATVEQVSDRFYTHDNAGGVTGDNQLRITFYNVDDDLLYIPFTQGASESGISVESLDGQVQDSNNFTWNLNASTFYGTFTRVFERQ